MLESSKRMIVLQRSLRKLSISASWFTFSLVSLAKLVVISYTSLSKLFVKANRGRSYACYFSLSFDPEAV